MNLGPYRLLEVLGTGGVARVYLAEHVLLRKRVAIKQLHPYWTRVPDVRQRFVQEARISCLLRHDCLIHVHDLCADGDAVYFVMDWVDGVNLAGYLERAQLPLSTSLDLAIRVADALDTVHAAGVLHLDLKTDNIVLRVDDDGDLRPVVLDFGIARVLGSASPPADALPVGTPRCMAPEQIANDPMDERTDVWSLGVLIYELVEGALPFGGEGSVRDMLIDIVASPPRPMSMALPRALRELVRQCLDKEQAGRPASAGAVRDRLIAIRDAYRSQWAALDRLLVESEVDAVIAELEADERPAATSRCTGSRRGSTALGAAGAPPTP